VKALAPPVIYAHENILFSAPRDPWGLYKLTPASYPGLPVSGKHQVKESLEAFAFRIEADFQVLRVHRGWSVEEYIEGALSTMSRRSGHLELFAPYLSRHRRVLAGRNVVRPEVFLAVRLRDPARDPMTIINQSLSRGGVREMIGALRDQLGLSDPRGMSTHELRKILDRERRAYERVLTYLDCGRATTAEIQWLIRRGYTRGLGEPRLDPHWRPTAISFHSEGDTQRYRPVEGDLIRLHESRLRIATRSLIVESELGRSHQAVLVVGALPEQTVFPGHDAELMFTPFEALDFPVDVGFQAEWVPNSAAVALARRRKVDADNIYDEESTGQHGPSADAYERPAAARELEARLTATDRPPLLKATLSIAVGAPSPKELEARIERLRSEFGRIELHRPLGEQHRLFLAMFPGQQAPIPDYCEHLLIEQFAAMVPTACNWAGSEVGPYIGHTLTGSMQPILFDLAEASERSRPPTVLMAGTLGSGKTIGLEGLYYQAFMSGSRIVDIDPKGDHHLDRLPGIDGHLEQIELSASTQWRGLLDPLRIGAPEIRWDLTVGFLSDLLPSHRDDWIIAIQEATKQLTDRMNAGGEAGSCSEVLELLRAGDSHAKAAARALSVHADTGLAQLGFADPESPLPPIGHAQVTTLRVRNLPRPEPGVARADYSIQEKLGVAVLRLVAMFAMRLAGGDRKVHKVLGFDEAAFLMKSNSAGRALIEQLTRWGRSENATTILLTHLVSDAEEIDNLIGPRFVFGFESPTEARKGLPLVGLDGDDDQMVQRVLGFRKGRCFFRDNDGRVVCMQYDLADPALLAALDTTPSRAFDLDGQGNGQQAVTDEITSVT
jgi:AAA-like domain